MFMGNDGISVSIKESMQKGGERNVSFDDLRGSRNVFDNYLGNVLIFDFL